MVTHFNAIWPAFGKPAKKGIQCRDEVAAMREIARVKPGKLKHQKADMRADGFTRLQEHPLKHARVKKKVVRGTCTRPEARQVRELFQRNGVRHLESKLKISRNLCG